MPLSENLLISKNEKAEAVSLQEGANFLPFTLDNGIIIMLSLRKTTVLYNSSFPQLLRLEAAVKGRLEELQNLGVRSSVEQYQMDTLKEYIEKLDRFKIERFGDDPDLGAEPNPFRERVSKLTKQLLEFLR
jgi:hypothetical protein